MNGQAAAEQLQIEFPFSHFTDQQVNEMHAFAYQLYNKRHYKDAGTYYQILTLARPSDAKFWKGYGACMQMLQEFEEALDHYAIAQGLNGEQSDPYLYVHAADCYFALKQKQNGLNALDAACSRAEQIKDQRVLNHVALMKQTWAK